MAAYGAYGYLAVGALGVVVVGLILSVIESRFRKPAQRRTPMTMNSSELTEAPSGVLRGRDRRDDPPDEDWGR
jgi:hypothetical protein